MPPSLPASQYPPAPPALTLRTRLLSRSAKKSVPLLSTATAMG